MKLTSNSTYSIIAAVLILAGGWWYFSSSAQEEMPLTEGAGADPTQAQFQSLASQLAAISFDTKIFSDVRFNSLVDLATPVAPEPSGRLDPFAPIPGSGAL